MEEIKELKKHLAHLQMRIESLSKYYDKEEIKDSWDDPETRSIFFEMRKRELEELQMEFNVLHAKLLFCLIEKPKRFFGLF